jgi:hypothetical protein
MILTFEQAQAIILKNPNKEYIDKGKEQATKLMLHLHGLGMDNALEHVSYFENPDVYEARKKYATSNKDLFARLLQQEDMVFSARGGSSYFNLPDSQESQMNEMLDNVRYDLSLRKWVKNFALQAYRADPMGIIMIEAEQPAVDANGQMNDPKAYPTYKSIFSIYDYLSTGRRLEYICFQLCVEEAQQYGITDEDFKGMKGEDSSMYFRIVDDAKDLILKKKDSTVILVTNITQPNPTVNPWKRAPGFVISDLIQFNEPQVFVSPLDFVVELADCFLFDRSVRDLQKKYHGFSKAVEPLLTCSTCAGQGFISGHACPSCAPPGAEKGTGFKMKTKVSDVARFSLDLLEKGSFDFNKIFGYVSPDIKGWEKQDTSLSDIEKLMRCTYWGETVETKTNGPATGQVAQETATKTDVNQRPIEARLNITADWAERTESMIADFIGQYWFETGWKKASISYGRDYILKTADELMETYQSMRTKGAPDFTLDEALERFYRARYQNNPVQLAKYLKMLDVEPFPHITVQIAKTLITDFNEYNAKLYFGEWANTVPDAKWISPSFTATKLITELKAYVSAKGLKEPTPEPAKPILN